MLVHPSSLLELGSPASMARAGVTINCFHGQSRVSVSMARAVFSGVKIGQCFPSTDLLACSMEMSSINRESSLTYSSKPYSCCCSFKAETERMAVPSWDAFRLETSRCSGGRRFGRLTCLGSRGVRACPCFSGEGR